MILIEHDLWRLPLYSFIICLYNDRTCLLGNEGPWSCSLSVGSWKGKYLRQRLCFDDDFPLCRVDLGLVRYAYSFGLTHTGLLLHIGIPNLASYAFLRIGTHRHSILGDQSVALQSKIGLKSDRPLDLKLLNRLSSVISHERGEILWRNLWKFNILNLHLAGRKLVGLGSGRLVLSRHLDGPWTCTSEFCAWEHFI